MLVGGGCDPLEQHVLQVQPFQVFRSMCASCWSQSNVKAYNSSIVSPCLLCSLHWVLAGCRNHTPAERGWGSLYLSFKMLWFTINSIYLSAAAASLGQQHVLQQSAVWNSLLPPVAVVCPNVAWSHCSLTTKQWPRSAPDLCSGSKAFKGLQPHQLSHSRCTYAHTC